MSRGDNPRCDHLDSTLSRCLGVPVTRRALFVKQGHSISLCEDHMPAHVERIEATDLPDVVKVWTSASFRTGGFLALVPALSPQHAHIVKSIAANMRAFVVHDKPDELVAGVLGHWAEQLDGLMDEVLTG